MGVVGGPFLLRQHCHVVFHFEDLFVAGALGKGVKREKGERVKG